MQFYIITNDYYYNNRLLNVESGLMMEM